VPIKAIFTFASANVASSPEPGIASAAVANVPAFTNSFLFIVYKLYQNHSKIIG
jgi:hypothetical protein